MSEPIPESIPTSQDPRSKRPTKRRALSPASAQASQLDALFANPDREVTIPPSATRNGMARAVAAPPEIVANVQGSSAGAGSGEFHVYKASRRREYERLRLMDEEVRREKEAEEFEKKQAELRRRDEAKTNKNKARREKMKARKMKKGKAGGEKGEDGAEDAGGTEATGGMEGPETGQTPSNGHGVEAEGDTRIAQEVGVIIHDDD